MQRFDMNVGFPKPSPRGIEPYIGSSLVLIHEDGDLVPLEDKGFGNTDFLSEETAQRLKRLQDKGFEIRGDVHPFYKNPIRIEEDMEIFQSFPPSVAALHLLTTHGVNLVYERETA